MLHRSDLQTEICAKTRYLCRKFRETSLKEQTSRKLGNRSAGTIYTIKTPLSLKREPKTYSKNSKKVTKKGIAAGAPGYGPKGLGPGSP